MSKIKIMSYDDVIESETDLTGKIIYVNDKFLEMVRGDRNTVMGKPHNIIRHPKMPKEVFEEMWDTIHAGKVWEGIILNICLYNEYTYWLHTVITPKIDENGKLVSYLSIRRQATPEEIIMSKKKYNI